MFSRTSITRYTGNYSENIKRLKDALDTAEAVVIGFTRKAITDCFNAPCCDETFDNEETIRRMVDGPTDMRIPSKLLPVCPREIARQSIVLTRI